MMFDFNESVIKEIQDFLLYNFFKEYLYLKFSVYSEEVKFEQSSEGVESREEEAKA